MKRVLKKLDYGIIIYTSGDIAMGIWAYIRELRISPTPFPVFIFPFAPNWWIIVVLVFIHSIAVRLFLKAYDLRSSQFEKYSNDPEFKRNIDKIRHYGSLKGTWSVWIGSLFLGTAYTLFLWFIFIPWLVFSIF